MKNYAFFEVIINNHEKYWKMFLNLNKKYASQFQLNTFSISC